MTSILPGTLVQALITSVHPDGLNLQVLGFFDGTIDQLHLGKQSSAYQIGKKVKARVLYEYSSSPPKFALTLADHVVKLGPRLVGDKTEGVQQLYPIGTVLEAGKVLRLEAERGLIIEVAPGVEGFVHVRTDPLLLKSSLTFFPPRYLIPLTITFHLCRILVHGNLVQYTVAVSLDFSRSMASCSSR